MIILSEVAEKLENILNGSDSETSEYTNPTDYIFCVKTEGFHLDNVMNQETKRNFIPVFISSMGGNFNPVKGLGEATYTIPFVFYFPVRFKDDFFVLNKYLVDVFVGASLNYGPLSGRAISNLSVAQFGEIQDLDFKEFQSWVNKVFRRPIEVMEPYMSMQLTLYLSTANPEFVYGNEATVNLKIDDPDDDELVEIDPSFATTSLQSQSQSTSQQIVGENETEGVPFGTSYGGGFSIYVKKNKFYKYLIKKWFEGKSQEVRVEFTLNFLGETFSRYCYIESVNMPITKGQLVSITLSFAKAIKDEEETE